MNSSQTTQTSRYRAKEEGRGTVRTYQREMDERIRDRESLQAELQTALNSRQFEVYYQPIVKVSTLQTVCFEALIRWHHPIRGLISPAEFIPLAEETGLIVPLGAWILRQACEEAAKWPDHISVAVNLSPIQLRSAKLVSALLAILASTGLSPNRLELEITESIVLENVPDVIQTLHRIRELGARISMDDFGTGYSSLAYLRRFPFDKIKIDGSFIKDIGQGDDAVAIVRAIVTMAHTFGIAVVAEGVETADQLAAVRAEGCTQVQGYLISQPLRVAELSKFCAPRLTLVASAA